MDDGDHKTLTVREAYGAMYNYVRNYYDQAKHSDDIFLMLHAMEIVGDDDTLDPASWVEWEVAVAEALSPRSDP